MGKVFIERGVFSGLMGKVYVCKRGDVVPGMVRMFNIKEREVLVANVAGEFFCIGNLCPHRQAPLSDGFLEGRKVICSHHGAEVDLESGKVSFPMPLPNGEKFPVMIEGEDVFIEI